MTSTFWFACRSKQALPFPRPSAKAKQQTPAVLACQLAPTPRQLHASGPPPAAGAGQDARQRRGQLPVPPGRAGGQGQGNTVCVCVFGAWGGRSITVGVQGGGRGQVRVPQRCGTQHDYASGPRSLRLCCRAAATPCRRRAWTTRAPAQRPTRRWTRATGRGCCVGRGPGAREPNGTTDWLADSTTPCTRSESIPI